ncbi:MAG: hypothetical protein LKM30_01980 [Bacilli bacterium]|jgi:CheY-like chemotaxis protein|nr:hypothetical protein [Bacilli bacterium]
MSPPGGSGSWNVRMPSASAIIAMTANAFPEDIQKAKEAGMNGHLAKPIDPRQIVSLLSAYFAK